MAESMRTLRRYTLLHSIPKPGTQVCIQTSSPLVSGFFTGCTTWLQQFAPIQTQEHTDTSSLSSQFGFIAHVYFLFCFVHSGCYYSTTGVCADSGLWCEQLHKNRFHYICKHLCSPPRWATLWVVEVKRGSNYNMIVQKRSQGKIVIWDHIRKNRKDRFHVICAVHTVGKKKKTDLGH